VNGITAKEWALSALGSRMVGSTWAEVARVNGYASGDEARAAVVAEFGEVWATALDRRYPDE